MRRLAVIILFAFAIGCAGPNPNPGERTTDMAWTSGEFARAFETAMPRAESGEPWAQLRVAIFFHNGWGTEKNLDKAEHWYKKAAAQKGVGNWSEGQLMGATGKAGYFNQNSDARVAQFNLAQLYYENDRNLLEAKVLLDTVIRESKGSDIFFCCEFSGGRHFTQQQLQDLKKRVEEKLASQ